MVSPGVRFVFIGVCVLWGRRSAVWRWGKGRAIIIGDLLRVMLICERASQSLMLLLCHPPQSSGNASYRCSMSSSADFSDEDDFSQNSGSASPAPGDTLPWNLPKHERSKRKIQGGSVLDPAERAVLRIADERDKVQKKTFTKWINQHLMKVRKHVNDLYEDLRDGHNLISLLEVLSGDTLVSRRFPNFFW